jgi:hypothetical protein
MTLFPCLQLSGCKISHIDDLSKKFKQFTKIHLAEKNKEDQRKWKERSRAKQRELNEQKYLAEKRNVQAKLIEKQREDDYKKVREIRIKES